MLENTLRQWVIDMYEKHVFISDKLTDVELPCLSHVDVRFLPKRTTAILRPLDLAVIASIKRSYQHLLNDRALSRIENGCTGNVYKISAKEAITWLYKIWYEMPNAIIQNCWNKSSIVHRNE